MKGEIEKAVDRLFERKKAALVETDGQRTDESGARKVFSGLDLDFTELDEFRAAATSAAMHGLTNNMDEGMGAEEALAHALAGLWVDGLGTGILLQEARDD